MEGKINKKVALKACPFCGSASLKIDLGSYESQTPAYVFCKDCVAIGPSGVSQFEAVYNWNHREEEPPQIQRLLNIRQVCSCLNLSRATIYRLIKEGKFPKPIKPLGTKSSRWAPVDIENYQQNSMLDISSSDVDEKASNLN